MKKFLAVIAGLIVFGVAVMLFEQLSHMLFPPPTELVEAMQKDIAEAQANGADMMDVMKISQRHAGGMMAKAPVMSLVLVILAHALGALFGGALVGRILREDTMNVGLTLGAILTILGLVNMIMIPHPDWFYLDFIVYIPCSMFGANYTSKL